MSSESRDKLLGLIQQACEEVDLSVSYDAKNESIVIVNQETKTPVFQSGKIIKSTGVEEESYFSNVFFAALALPFFTVSLMFFVSKKIGLFVK
jgi:hypothetical protein